MRKVACRGFFGLYKLVIHTIDCQASRVHQNVSACILLALSTYYGDQGHFKMVVVLESATCRHVRLMGKW